MNDITIRDIIYSMFFTNLYSYCSDKILRTNSSFLKYYFIQKSVINSIHILNHTQSYFSHIFDVVVDINGNIYLIRLPFPLLKLYDFYSVYFEFDDNLIFNNIDIIKDNTIFREAHFGKIHYFYNGIIFEDSYYSLQHILQHFSFSNDFDFYSIFNKMNDLFSDLYSPFRKQYI